ncbi:hypothetical protein HYFRA_00013667 [Hymenoscyphus fraxineus]|uniref:Uncharacterized protein n=1 Tax=Hymenoscyphus fraxineus TaxID=746836 RepID=A0A9N9Q1K6_9HELO|nr:hypothetical protein HYFRA_00013667 [Hymenoscyphus fraxineus]
MWFRSSKKKDETPQEPPKAESATPQEPEPPKSYVIGCKQGEPKIRAVASLTSTSFELKYALDHTIDKEQEDQGWNNWLLDALDGMFAPTMGGIKVSDIDLDTDLFSSSTETILVPDMSDETKSKLILEYLQRKAQEESGRSSTSRGSASDDDFEFCR